MGGKEGGTKKGWGNLQRKPSIKCNIRVHVLMYIVLIDVVFRL
jgi:hypothetical protein